MVVVAGLSSLALRATGRQTLTACAVCRCGGVRDVDLCVIPPVVWPSVKRMYCPSQVCKGTASSSLR